MAKNTGITVKYPSEFQCWQNIKKRCFNDKHPQYRHYGGRGISMIDEWRDSFAKFMEYVGPKPHAGMSLDRIDNDKGYEPGNLRWATPRTQAANRQAQFRAVVYQNPVAFITLVATPMCF